MNNAQNELGPIDRLTAPTPRFFTIIRNVGIMLAALSGALFSLQAQGMTLPDWIIQSADKAYMLSGAIAALVAQFTVDFEKLRASQQLDNFR